MADRGVFYATNQNEDFHIGTRVKALSFKQGKISKKVRLFLVSAINKLQVLFTEYSQNATDKLPFLKITLPTHNGAIDFAFMETFIAELEAYLTVTGLKDYTLTEEEEKVLNSLDKVQWKEFTIGDLFEIKTSKRRFDANKIQLSEEGHPYVVRTASNNGIKGFLKENEKYLNEGNTISFGQDTATMFYQKQPYFTGDKIKVLQIQ